MDLNNFSLVGQAGVTRISRLVCAFGHLSLGAVTIDPRGSGCHPLSMFWSLEANLHIGYEK